jgi:hypothetical protein
MRSVLFVPWPKRAAIMAMLPSGALLIIAGSWWRRAPELDAIQEASNKVAAAPVAIGFVFLVLKFAEVFNAGHE